MINLGNGTTEECGSKSKEQEIEDEKKRNEIRGYKTKVDKGL